MAIINLTMGLGEGMEVNILLDDVAMKVTGASVINNSTTKSIYFEISNHIVWTRTFGPGANTSVSIVPGQRPTWYYTDMVKQNLTVRKKIDGFTCRASTIG